MSEIIRCEHLRYVYNAGLPDETAALDDVSFSIEEGDFVGIIGSTGSGKSTLISHFNGLNRPTSGKIYVDGRDMWAEGEDLRSFRFLVGLVFQYPEYQLFEETCAQDIAYGPRNMGLSEEEIQRRVKEAAEFTGLSEELLQRSPFELSGGQKRRVAIAGVMAMEPRILVLDEPAAGLDPLGKKELMALLHRLHADWCKTVVFVSHDMDEVAENCSRVAVFADGQIKYVLTPRALFSKFDELDALGLELPAAAKIARLLHEEGIDIESDFTPDDFAEKAAAYLSARLGQTEKTEKGEGGEA